ncbi:MAG: MBL fold metallo-hydrolase [Bacteroidota bacterium]|uniref:MBL fold metallo-hydrolase n=1 Tax=Flagellimonas okinawensis TaxID=3031324 RepID=A0ABT5XRC4_9FLAO|nr:MBL fold metallo-hydrolase [[Muricauda] okinawensis]MDF0708450.1 MBL fold metallo-hydrolase [[Muricauda] okinawensis]MEC8832575.1 MBL fold metallo-hydrolase [Bacteroidota bacterium]
MKKNIILTASALLVLFTSCKEKKENQDEKTEVETVAVMESPDPAKIIPIEHATALIEWDGKTIYVDPVGGKAAFEGQNSPDMIFITDIHGDHFNPETLNELDLEGVTIIAPDAVKLQMEENLSSKTTTMKNGESKEMAGFNVEAIPMYNLREEAKDFHTKGRGNGYVFTFGDERIYFSGDTEDIPEMRALENIDKAFVCMNLPFTMTEESAADAVLEFKPKQVYPYHYRGRPEVSDVEKFKTIVNEGDNSIEVVQLDWYPNEEY